MNFYKTQCDNCHGKFDIFTNALSQETCPDCDAQESLQEITIVGNNMEKTMTEQIKFETKVKNSIRGYGMIQDTKLKPITGKRVTVTIDVDEGTEVTQTVTNGGK